MIMHKCAHTQHGQANPYNKHQHTHICARTHKHKKTPSKICNHFMSEIVVAMPCVLAKSLDINLTNFSPLCRGKWRRDMYVRSCKKCGGVGCKMLCKWCEVCYFVDVLRADFLDVLRADFGNPWALAKSLDINLTNFFALVKIV